jgi:hypothetical protein
LKRELLLVVVVLLVVGILGVAYVADITYTPAQSTTSSSTTGSTNTSSSNAPTALPSGCPQANNSSLSLWYSQFRALVATTSQTAVVCLRLYYYNSTAATTINVTSALSIEAVHYIANSTTMYLSSFNGASNFTVTSSQSQLVIGGPGNENEGTTIAYAIMAKPGASGTYELGLRGDVWILSPQAPVPLFWPGCGGFLGKLVAGNGQPNYLRMMITCGTVITTSQGSTPTSAHTVSGVPYQLPNGDIYIELTGVFNSTHIGSAG